MTAEDEKLIERLRRGVQYWTPPGAFTAHPNVNAGDALMEEAASAVSRLSTAESILHRRPIPSRPRRPKAGDGQMSDAYWLELREPGCVPERKGPFPPKRVVGFLREVMMFRPGAFITVITIGSDGTPYLQDGPECLMMLDMRSRSTAMRHIQTSRRAFAEPVNG